MKVDIKKYTFNKIKDLLVKNELELPDCQNSLRQEKVDGLVNSYLNNKEFWAFKKNIIIGKLNKKFYIIDGQHRIQASKILLSKNIKDDLTFCIYECNNENDIRKLFIESNYDSVKNHNYINSSTFNQVKMDNFTKLLKKDYKSYFGKGELKKIENFRSELNNINFFNLFDNSEDLLSYLIQKSADFYEQANYEGYLNNSETLFYKYEIDSLKSKICFSTTKNNFMDFLENNVKPMHSFKAQKKRITRTLKNKVWNKYYQCEEDMCPINNCTNIISKNNFEAGHIIAESKGGDTTLDNLRPICKSCNSSMGNKSWFEYESEI